MGGFVRSLSSLYQDPGALGEPAARCERRFREERQPSDYTVGVRSHQWIDQRSLALHEAVAAKLEAHPQLLDVARQNLERWLQQNPATAVREWRRILDSTPLPEVVALLRSSSDEAARLRQSSPFAGLLTTEERRAIMGVYESRRA
jgi:CBS-domain-containing membrane protein